MVATLTTVRVLCHIDYDSKVIIHSGGSDDFSARVLSQIDDEGVQHFVAYFSRKYTLVEFNYDIYDKKLMAIIKVHEQSRPECKGALYTLSL
jgi:hypothetical protein